MKIVLIVFSIFTLIIAIAMSLPGGSHSPGPEAKLREAIRNPDPKVAEAIRKEEALANLTIKNFTWNKTYNIMMATFIFKNQSKYSIKDIKVRCIHTAPSGTEIDANERTIFEIIPANSTRTIKEFNMGFIHSQASRTRCEVAGAKIAD